MNPNTDWFREAGYDDPVVLPPEKTGRLYRWTYQRNLIIGSGVNVMGTRGSGNPEVRRTGL